MSASLIAEKRAALIAQCPPATRLPEAEAIKLPINVTRLGTGPSVVIIHGGVQGGLGGGPVTFDKQRSMADLGWELAMVERPGFGQSPSRGVDDMESDAIWIAELLGDGAHLIGHSWGGAESLLAAARRPQAVRSLVLVEPALQMLALTDPRVQADPVARGNLTRMGAMLLTAGSPRDYGLAFASGLGPTTGNAPDLGGLDEAAARLGCALLQARMASPAAMRQAAEIVADARIPVLVISGGWSPIFDTTGEVVARLTRGHHLLVASPNHFPQLENPNEFNGAVDAFMRAAMAKPESDRTG